jgi:hypothetical protein
MEIVKEYNIWNEDRKEQIHIKNEIKEWRENKIKYNKIIYR